MHNLTVHDISLSSWPLIHKAAYCGDYAILEDELNNDVAYAKLEAMGIKIDKWTEEQYKYNTSFEEGT